MQALTSTASRRAWLEAERRAVSIAPPSGPTVAQTFLRGFMRASMLQLAVCAPPRQAATRKVDAVFIARLGERVEAKGASATRERVPA
ncbi:MAG: hypothetical protein GC160_29495 [Acidobacteria bacterium]|nr:hypothetical protein [Acidobacteriota bacterium]